MGLHVLWVTVGVIFEKKPGNVASVVQPWDKFTSCLLCSLHPWRVRRGSAESFGLAEDKLRATLQTLAPQAPVVLLHRSLRVETKSKEKQQNNCLILVPKISRISPVIGNKEKEKRKRGNWKFANVFRFLLLLWWWSVATGDTWLPPLPKKNPYLCSFSIALMIYDRGTTNPFCPIDL